MKHSLTCSGLSLALHCSWSFRPDAQHAVEEPGRWAVNNAIHAVFARTILTGREDCEIPADLLDQLTDGEVGRVRRAHSDWLGDWWLDQRDGGWEAEVAFAFDPETGASMRIKPAFHRDYSQVPEGWVPGTADVVRRFEDAAVDGIDWKSGWRAPEVEENAQLAGIALGAGARSFRGAIGHSSDDDGVQLRWMTLDRFDLLDWRERIGAIVRRIPTAEAVPGPWCRDSFCRSYGLCPATEGSLDLVAPDAKRHLPVVAASSAIESPEHAAELYRLAREARAHFDARYNAVFQALRIYADEHGGVPLPGGKVWMRRDTTRESIDLAAPGAARVLGEQLGEKAFAAAIEMSTTKTAIKRAARLVKETTGEAIANVEKRTLAALRAVNAVKVSSSASYTEAPAEREALPAA